MSMQDTENNACAAGVGAAGTEEEETRIVEMIMRQTNYTKDVAQEKLKVHKNDYMQVIRDYMMPPAKPPQCAATKLSVNQQIYKEIRGMMDEAAKRYEAEKSKKN